MVSKRDLVYFVAGLLDRGRVYEAAEVTGLIRASVHPRHLADPRLAPDHLRLGLVEEGFAGRDALAANYWRSALHFGPTDEADLLAKVRELMQDDSVELIECPACGNVSGVATIVCHVQVEHGSARWLRLLARYGN